MGAHQPAASHRSGSRTLIELASEMALAGQSRFDIVRATRLPAAKVGEIKRPANAILNQLKAIDAANARREDMERSQIKSYAEQLSDLMMQIEDLKVQATAIVDHAKDEGATPSDIKALKKVAKELTTDSAKLAKMYEFESQLDLFRSAVNLRQRKGLVERELQAAE